jgi:PhnB protein
MQMNIYLFFNGQCEEACRFYAKLLGGKIEAMSTYADAPPDSSRNPQVPPEWGNKIMHAHVTAGDMTLMASDAPPQHFQQPQGFSVSLNVDKPAEAERMYRELAKGGQQTMPIQETFWALRFGMLTDRFGIPWMVNCQKQEI